MTLTAKEASEIYYKFIIEFYYHFNARTDVPKEVLVNLEQSAEKESKTSLRKLLLKAMNKNSFDQNYEPDSYEKQNNFFEVYLSLILKSPLLKKETVTDSILFAERSAGFSVEELHQYIQNGGQ